MAIRRKQNRQSSGKTPTQPKTPISGRQPSGGRKLPITQPQGLPLPPEPTPPDGRIRDYGRDRECEAGEVELVFENASFCIAEDEDYLNLNGSQSGFELTGEIPSAMQQLTNLVLLSLTGNQLTGEIPQDFFQAFPNLIILGLSGNNFEESPFPWIWNLPIESFQAMGAGLVGEIPPEIGWLSNTLRTFRVEYNNLSGSIPSTICSVMDNFLYTTSFGIVGNKFCEPFDYPNCILESNWAYNLIGDPQNCSYLCTEYGYPWIDWDYFYVPISPGTVQYGTDWSWENVPGCFEEGDWNFLKYYIQRMTEHWPQLMWWDMGQQSWHVDPDVEPVPELEHYRLYAFHCNNGHAAGTWPDATSPPYGEYDCIDHRIPNGPLIEITGDMSDPPGGFGYLEHLTNNSTHLTELMLVNQSLYGTIPDAFCELPIATSLSSKFDVTYNALCPPYPDCGEIQIDINSQYTEDCEISIGDVNLDFQVDVSDVILLVEEILNTMEGDDPTFTELQQQLADINQSGTIDILDVVILVEMILAEGAVLTSGEQQQLQDALSRLQNIPEGTRVRVDGRQPSGGRKLPITQPQELQPIVSEELIRNTPTELQDILRQMNASVRGGDKEDKPGDPPWIPPIQSTVQAPGIICTNVNDCWHGCDPTPDDLTDCEDTYNNAFSYGVLWYDEDNPHELHPHNSPYWTDYIEMFLLDDTETHSIPFLEEGDILVVADCGPGGNACGNPMTDIDFNSKIGAYIWIPGAGCRCYGSCGTEEHEYCESLIEPSDECPPHPGAYQEGCYWTEGGMRNAVQIIYTLSGVSLYYHAYIDGFGLFFMIMGNVGEGSGILSGNQFHTFIFKSQQRRLYRTDYTIPMPDHGTGTSLWIPRWYEIPDDIFNEPPMFYQNLNWYLWKTVPFTSGDTLGCTDPSADNYVGEGYEELIITNYETIFGDIITESNVDMGLVQGTVTTLDNESSMYQPVELGDEVYSVGNLNIDDQCNPVTDSWACFTGDSHFYLFHALVPNLTYSIPYNFRIWNCASSDCFNGGATELSVVNNQVILGTGWHVLILENISIGVATLDDGSCTYGGMVYGCSDPEAENYNPDAISCSGEPNDLSCCSYPIEDCTVAFYWENHTTDEDGGNIEIMLDNDILPIGEEDALVNFFQIYIETTDGVEIDNVYGITLQNYWGPAYGDLWTNVNVSGNIYSIAALMPALDAELIPPLSNHRLIGIHYKLVDTNTGSISWGNVETYGAGTHNTCVNPPREIDVSRRGRVGRQPSGETSGRREPLDDSDTSNLGEWYVELKEEPLVKTYNVIKRDSNKLNKLQQRKSELLNILDSTENEIINILDGSEKIKSKTYKGSTAFFLDSNISDNEIKQIKSLSTVKRVTYTPAAKIVLDASIPLINADDVWNSQDENNNQLTGEGTKIGIIDTGVTSTHPDLGGSADPVRYESNKFRSITETVEENIVDLDYTQVLGFKPLISSNRKIAIPSDRNWYTTVPDGYGHPFYEDGQNVLPDRIWASDFIIYDYDTDSIVDTITVKGISTGWSGSPFSQAQFEDPWFVWMAQGNNNYLWHPDHPTGENDDSWENVWTPHIEVYNSSTDKLFELLTMMEGNSFQWHSPGNYGEEVGCGFNYGPLTQYGFDQARGFSSDPDHMVQIKQSSNDDSILYVLAHGRSVRWDEEIYQTCCLDSGGESEVGHGGNSTIHWWKVHETEGVIDYNLIYETTDTEYGGSDNEKWSPHARLAPDGKVLIAPGSVDPKLPCKNYYPDCVESLGDRFYYYIEVDNAWNPPSCLHPDGSTTLQWYGRGETKACGNAPNGCNLILKDPENGTEEQFESDVIDKRGSLLGWDSDTNIVVFQKHFATWCGDNQYDGECGGHMPWIYDGREGFGLIVYDLNTNEIILDHGPLYPDGDNLPWPPEPDPSRGTENYNDTYISEKRIINDEVVIFDNDTIFESINSDTNILEEPLYFSYVSGGKGNGIIFRDNKLFMTNGSSSDNSLCHDGRFTWVYDLNTNNLVQLNTLPDKGGSSSYKHDYKNGLYCYIRNSNGYIFCHDLETIGDYYSPYLNLYETAMIPAADTYHEIQVPYVIKEDESPIYTNDKVVGGWNFSGNNGDFSDGNGHGTHVAATAAGKAVTTDGLNGADGLNGVAPDALLYGYKVCNNSGLCFGSSIVAAIEASMDPDNTGDFDNPLDVINMSLGGPGNPEGSYYKSYIDAAIDVGVTVVCSAGNSGPAALDDHCWHYDHPGGASHSICCPSCVEGTISVAASTSDGLYWWDEENNPDIPDVDGVTSFSSRGPTWPGEYTGIELNKPDVSAPGVNIKAAYYQGGHWSISGTSMASPHVAGVAALIKQMDPNLTPYEIKTLIMNTSTDIGYEWWTQGQGRIDPYETLLLHTGSIKGCIDPEACNYNSDATIEGSCDYGNVTCPVGSEFEGETVCNIIDCGHRCNYYQQSIDLMIAVFSMYGSSLSGNCEDGFTDSGLIYIYDCIDYIGYESDLCSKADSNGTGWISSFDVYNSFCNFGCVDENACNYNSLSCYDDGSCDYPIEGCTCDDYAQYPLGVDCDEYNDIDIVVCKPDDCDELFSSCVTLWSSSPVGGGEFGCTESMNDLYETGYWCGATNNTGGYEVIMTNDNRELWAECSNGTFVLFKICGSPCETDANGGCDPYYLYENGDYACAYGGDPITMTGCTDPEACNYFELALTDDGSCWYNTPPCTCEDGQGAVDVDGDGICDTIDDCVGEYDECGVCNGNGAEIECEDGSFVCDESDCPEEEFILELHEGNNLISFPISLEYYDDGAIADVFDDNRIKEIIGEGLAATQISPGYWVGSLTHIIPTGGYWVYFVPDVTPSTETFSYIGEPLPSDIIYSLHRGNNLISFPFNGCMSIFPAVSMEFSGDGGIVEIIGEGLAASYINGNWVGSLEELCGGDGYWLDVDIGEGETIQFQWLSEY